MGRSQAVRHQTLNLAFRWSDPTRPSHFRKEETYPMNDDYDFMLCAIAEYYGTNDPQSKQNDSDKDQDQYLGDSRKADYR